MQVKSYTLLQATPDQKRVVRMKGVSKRVAEMLDNDEFSVKPSVSHFQSVRLGPSLTSSIFLSVTSKRNATVLNLKRSINPDRVTTEGLH